MMREAIGSGEIFEPKTVASSYRINCDSTFAYLFAIDLQKNEFVWLNAARSSNLRVAGESSVAFLEDIINSALVLSVYDFATMLATEVVAAPEEADVVFSDQDVALKDGAQQIRSCEFEKLLALMNL